MSLQVHIARFLIRRPVPMLIFFNFAHVFHTEGVVENFWKTVWHEGATFVYFPAKFEVIPLTERPLQSCKRRAAVAKNYAAPPLKVGHGLLLSSPKTVTNNSPPKVQPTNLPSAKSPNILTRFQLNILLVVSQNFFSLVIRLNMILYPQF